MGKPSLACHENIIAVHEYEGKDQDDLLLIVTTGKK
jgi:hypothetical protein